MRKAACSALCLLVLSGCGKKPEPATVKSTFNRLLQEQSATDWGEPEWTNCGKEVGSVGVYWAVTIPYRECWCHASTKDRRTAWIAFFRGRRSDLAFFVTWGKGGEMDVMAEDAAGNEDFHEAARQVGSALLEAVNP
jgi:hypothetical protein